MSGVWLFVCFRVSMTLSQSVLSKVIETNVCFYQYMFERKTEGKKERQTTKPLLGTNGDLFIKTRLALS